MIFYQNFMIRPKKKTSVSHRRVHRILGAAWKLFFCKIRFYSFSWKFSKLKGENQTTNKKVMAKIWYPSPPPPIPPKKEVTCPLDFWIFFDEKHLLGGPNYLGLKTSIYIDMNTASNNMCYKFHYHWHLVFRCI